MNLREKIEIIQLFGNFARMSRHVVTYFIFRHPLQVLIIYETGCVIKIDQILTFSIYISLAIKSSSSNQSCYILWKWW